jgi:hypothetical protein
MATTINKVNAEIAAIKLLHPDPTEAIYRWIDNAIGIPPNSLGGGILVGIDALPVYIYGKTGKLYCTALPLVPYMFRKMKFKELPVLCGMAKYDITTGKFLEAILLESWPRDMRGKLKEAIKEAYEYMKTLRDEDERQGAPGASSHPN